MNNINKIERQIHIKNFFNDIKLKIQPLNVHELNELIFLAMKTGFWGNSELITFVVNRGCVDKNVGKQIIEHSDIFTIYHLARKIWILTLEELAKISNRLWKLVDNQAHPLIIKKGSR